MRCSSIPPRSPQRPGWTHSWEQGNNDSGNGSSYLVKSCCALPCFPRNISSQATWESKARTRGPQPVTPLGRGLTGSRLGWSGCGPAAPARPLGVTAGPRSTQPHNPVWVGATPVTAFKLVPRPRRSLCLAFALPASLPCCWEPFDLTEVRMYLARDGVS